MRAYQEEAQLIEKAGGMMAIFKGHREKNERRRLGQVMVKDWFNNKLTG